jgi:TPR repeat protein
MYFEGRGVVQDYVQAHKWTNLAASRQTGEERKMSADACDALAGLMTPEQIAEAQRLARAWDAAHPRAPHCTPSQPAVGSRVHPVTLRSAA